MSKFRNLFRRDTVVIETPTGSPISDVKKWTVDKNGNQVFKVTGRVNTYEEIQAARDSVDLLKMIERYQAGDESALNRVNAMYYDSVDMPRNYAELYKAVQTCTDIFNGMPVEIKEQFANNPAKFWQMSGSQEFQTIIENYRNKKTAAPAPEVSPQSIMAQASPSAAPVVEASVTTVESKEV